MECPPCADWYLVSDAIPDARLQVFELQLLSSILYHLKPHVGTAFDVDCISMATTAVYTCADSCWDDAGPGYVEEYTFVQEDPDAVTAEQLEAMKNYPTPSKPSA